MRACRATGIPVTISGGKSNLTGSATPDGGVVLSTVALQTPAVQVAEAIVRSSMKAGRGNKAVIVVSDTTRPVPYRGESGILEPILDTHAGFVGINHYQAAKAAVEASKAVRPGGTMILAANHTDVDPVGGPDYRRVLPMLTELGWEEFTRRITDPSWQFIPEQREVQMWARAIGKLGDPSNLVYCAPALTGESFARRRIPGRDGGAGITGLAGRDLAEAMVQRAIDNAVAAAPGSRIAVFGDGPYAVPRLFPGTFPP